MIDMPVDITISSITGQTPFNVYICDSGSTTCIYVDTIVSGDLPYTFEVPGIYSTMDSFNVRVVDSNSCEINEVVSK
jgi:hypothetical protein